MLKIFSVAKRSGGSFLGGERPPEEGAQHIVQTIAGFWSGLGLIGRGGIKKGP